MVELAVIGVVLLVALAAAFMGSRPRLPAACGLTIALVGGTAALSLEHGDDLTARTKRLGRERSERPLEHTEDGYVGSARCQSCHPGEHASWHATHHARMTQVPDEGVILADFDEVELVNRGRSYRMWREGRDHMVEFVDPAYDWSVGKGLRKPLASGTFAPTIERRIVLVTGSHNVQVYWVEGDVDRRLEFFPLVWKIDTAEWMPLADMFLKDPETPEYLTRWNEACIQCHTTAPRMRMHEGREPETAVSEHGIACESCHGPGARHVAANGNPLRRYRARLEGRDETIVNPARLPHDRASEVCGQCHGLGWHRDEAKQLDRNGTSYRPGDELSRSRILMDPSFPAQRRRMGETYARNHFWGDGVVRVSGRDFSGMRKSACFTEGELSCLDCHTMHGGDPDDQLSLAGTGGKACLDCHQDIAADVTAHTGHEPHSSGNSCYACHMPHVTYGLMKSIRNHYIGSPSVRETVDYGRPNACNLCHVGESLAWAATHLQARHGHPAHTVSELHRELSSTFLDALTGDAAQRALAVDALGRAAERGDDALPFVPVLAHLLEDPYGAVRYMAERALRKIEGFSDVRYDHLADEAARGEARARVMERFRIAASSHAGAPRFLLGPGGVIDRQRWDRLAATRDDTPMELAE